MNRMDNAGAEPERHTLDALVHGRLSNPFAVLGPHETARGRAVRGYFPGAHALEVRGAKDGRLLAQLAPHPEYEGFFCGLVPGHSAYVFLIQWPGGVQETEDVYSFGELLSEVDLYLFSEGTHWDLATRFGANLTDISGVHGVRFAVWAPNAHRVSLLAGSITGMGAAIPCDFGTRRAFGNCSFRALAPASATNTRSWCPWRTVAAEVRSARMCNGTSARSPPRLWRGAGIFRGLLGMDVGPIAHERHGRPISVYEVHPGVLAAVLKGSPIQSWMARTGTAPDSLCQRARLHAYRIHADHGASLWRVLGISADGPVCAYRPLRQAAGTCAISSISCHRANHRTNSRLGAGTFSGRFARPRAFRRNGPLRARRSPGRVPPRIGTR